jgi:hypothetical protein
MNDDLVQRFEGFSRGACQPDAFERELLALCGGTPARAWEVLALLDQFYRRRMISEELCRRLRQKIGRQAMRLEGHTVEPEPPARAAAASAQVVPISAPIAEPRVAEPRVAEPRVAERQVAEPRVPEPADRGQTEPPRRNAIERANSSGMRWRRGFQTSPAIGLIAVVLGGVSASTKVQDTPRLSLAGIVAPAAPAPPEPEADRGPGVISLSSDRYLVYPHQRALEFTVERTIGTGGDAGFVWWTQPAGARSSEDYIGTRVKTAAVPEGAASMHLQVPILANPQRRHIEMFYIVIGKADGGAELGPIHRAAVFIFPDGKP